MKLSCLQENLSKGLTVVGRAVATRATLPITANVLLSADQGMLKLSATNLEIAITAWVGAMIEEEGAITVPARLLTEFVNSLPSDRVDLTLEPGSGVLQVACARSQARINGMDADDFPPIPTVKDGVTAQVAPLALRVAIGRVAFTAATSEGRPVLTGVEVKLSGDKFTMAAADGFRLAVYNGALAQPVSAEAKVIVPAKTLNEISRLLSDRGDPVELMITPARGQILFRVGGVEVVSQLLQGSFPNYEQLIPKKWDTRVVVDAGKLRQAIEASAIFAREGSNIIRLRFEPGDSPGIQVSGQAEQTGSAQDVVTAESIEAHQDEGNRIAVNSVYLLAALGALGKGQATLELTTSSLPLVIRPTEAADSYVQVMMPMFVQGWSDE